MRGRNHRSAREHAPLPPPPPPPTAQWVATSRRQRAEGRLRPRGPHAYASRTTGERRDNAAGVSTRCSPPRGCRPVSPPARGGSKKGRRESPWPETAACRGGASPPGRHGGTGGRGEDCGGWARATGRIGAAAAGLNSPSAVPRARSRLRFALNWIVRGAQTPRSSRRRLDRSRHRPGDLECPPRLQTARGVASGHPPRNCRAGQRMRVTACRSIGGRSIKIGVTHRHPAEGPLHAHGAVPAKPSRRKPAFPFHGPARKRSCPSVFFDSVRASPPMERKANPIRHVAQRGRL